MVHMTTSMGGGKKMENLNSKKDPEYEVVKDEHGLASIKVKRDKKVEVEAKPKEVEAIPDKVVEKPKKKSWKISK